MGYSILVTGGAGFIGAALAKRLSEKNQVTILDVAGKNDGLLDAVDEDYAIDIRDAQQLDQLRDRTFDVVYHLAAQTSGAVSQEQPQLDVDTNVKGTLNICNLARVCKTRKIIYSSSMAVYGNPANPKIAERVPPVPVSNYGVSKLSGEYFVKMQEQYGIDYTIFRLFNVYGPGQDMKNLRQGMASIYMAQAILSDEIKVTGSFDRYRDFVYVDDVVEALLLAGEKHHGKTLNVGSGQKTTVRELIDLIIGINDKPEGQIKAVGVGSHEGDQFGTVADNELLLSLGWKNRTSLEVGLKKMYEYAKGILQ
jgi:UDP-glucose 4-epimerase